MTDAPEPPVSEIRHTSDRARALVPVAKVPKTDKYLPASTLRALYDAIDNPRDRAYLMYHAETGLRVQDVLRSEWVHLDWTEHRTHTYDHKKDEWRYVYWPAKCEAALKMWRLQMQNEGIKSPYLFPFDPKTANRILRRWLVKIGFRYASLASSHWLRHTFIRLSRQAGRDLVLVRQNTGDTYKTILEWYEGLNAEDMRKQLEGRPLIPEGF